MKLAAFLLVLGLAGCAVNPAQQNRAVSRQQLDSYPLSEGSCRNIDYHVNFAEEQLRLKGFLYASPESLNDEDRKYNASARIMIWSLRIGCNNPGRYKS